MRKPYIILALLLIGTALNATKYAGEIFLLGPGVPNQAMGNTGLTWSGSLAAGWWNPALLAVSEENGVELMRSEHFEGLLQQNQISVIFGSKTHTSLQINHLAIDKIKLTVLENPADTLSNENRPIVWKTVGNNDVILYGSLARSLRPNLHIGITPKLAYRNLAQNSGCGFGADLGMLWNSGHGLLAAANLRDFFSTQIIWENGTHETALPNIDLELGYGLKLFKQSVPVHLALRTQVYAENRGEASNIDAGIFSADLHAGVLVQPISALDVMAGWDTDSFTAGLGVRWQGLGLDYAWRSGVAENLSSSQRLSLNYRW